jgi:hypothetical protein
MPWTVFMGSFAWLTALLYPGCAMPAEGVFENQTSHSITVTIVGSSFDIWSEDTQEYIPSSYGYFTVYSKAVMRIRSMDQTIKFRWGAGSAETTRKIYVANDGGKVTFKE